MPAPRPRARAIRAKSGKSFVSIYNPADYMKWKDATAEALGKFAGVPFSNPVKLAVVFSVTRPKTTKLAAPKPDIDNYIKSLLDAMTDASFWDDDTLVHKITAEKTWALPGALGSIHFTVEEIK